MVSRDCLCMGNVEYFILFHVNINSISTDHLPINRVMSGLYHTLSFGAEINGAKFNKIYHQTKFYKFLYDDLIHHDFHYKLGLNVDHVPFKPYGLCSSGGLYFCEQSKCHMYWNRYGTKLGIVEIPDDARVYIEGNKFKTDKLILTNIIDFNDILDDFWIDIVFGKEVLAMYIRAVKENGLALEYIKDPFKTYELCKIAIKENGLALQYVEDSCKTYELCEMAIIQNAASLEFVNDIYQTDELCKMAVSQRPFTLQYVSNQTFEICEIAIQTSSSALRYVKVSDISTDPNHQLTPKMAVYTLCKIAIQQGTYALQYIKTILEQTKIHDDTNENVDILINDLWVLAILQDPCALMYVDDQDQTEDLCRLAVTRNGLALRYVCRKTEDICRLAIEQNSDAKRYTPDYQTDDASTSDCEGLEYWF